MDEAVIKVRNLSKSYRIGEPKSPYIRDSIYQWMKAVFSRGLGQDKSPLIWALSDISFDIARGEMVGIIGRNGAGKTTLLKILSRITEPVTGYAEIRGRVASLLEVGTGFHGELTGRENVYLSGALLGMRKVEIDRKFDEIVAFSEVEKFIDTPVKHYSSGMTVRLAFAVAAHLEPEILLVDEVLAVGDIAFQKKCLGKMGDVGKSGRTVLFVTHQMNQIRRLCERVIWLDKSRIKKIGPTMEVVGEYEAVMTSGEWKGSQSADAGKIKSRIVSWEITEPRSPQPNTLDSTGPVTVKFRVEFLNAIKNMGHDIMLLNAEGQIMWGAAATNINLEAGTHDFSYSLATLPLRPGVYYWRLIFWEYYVWIDTWDCVPGLLVAAKPLAHPKDEMAGILNIPYELKINGNPFVA